MGECSKGDIGATNLLLLVNTPASPMNSARKITYSSSGLSEDAEDLDHAIELVKEGHPNADIDKGNERRVEVWDNNVRVAIITPANE